MTAGIAVVALIAFVALAIMAQQANQVTVEDIILPAVLEPPPNADGMAWGSETATVLIEEYGDYQ